MQKTAFISFLEQIPYQRVIVASPSGSNYQISNESFTELF